VPNRDLIFQPLFDPRIVGGNIIAPPLNPAYVNSLRGYARGVELFVQRSSANRFTGWISYAYGRTGCATASLGKLSLRIMISATM